jgi:hypothetical protein
VRSTGRVIASIHPQVTSRRPLEVNVTMPLGGKCGAKPGFVALVEFSVYGSSVRTVREIVVIDEAVRP